MKDLEKVRGDSHSTRTKGYQSGYAPQKSLGGMLAPVLPSVQRCQNRAGNVVVARAGAVVPRDCNLRWGLDMGRHVAVSVLDKGSPLNRISARLAIAFHADVIESNDLVGPETTTLFKIGEETTATVTTPTTKTRTGSHGMAKSSRTQQWVQCSRGCLGKE